MEKIIDETPYKKQEDSFIISPATKDEASFVLKKLVAFNNTKVPFTQAEEAIYKNYVIKDNGKIVAGLNAMIYHWHIVFVDILFVDEEYRGQDFGSALLNRIEADAKAMGSTLIHLDTFDFQAKDFYLKNGYEIFGVIEDCPPGHKMYYLFKRL